MKKKAETVSLDFQSMSYVNIFSRALFKINAYQVVTPPRFFSISNPWKLRHLHVRTCTV